MNQYYRVTIKLSYEDKKGNIKFKKENYIVYAISPSDVEAKLVKYLGVEDYEIIGINITGIIDVIK
jgi:hypothetical protein